MTTLQEKLAYLDAALTRVAWKDVEHTARTQNVSADRFFRSDNLYYLSDGGYSRLVVLESGIRVAIGARQEVIDGWQYCKELIADVESAIAEELGEPYPVREG